MSITGTVVEVVEDEVDGGKVVEVEVEVEDSGGIVVLVVGGIVVVVVSHPMMHVPGGSVVVVSGGRVVVVVVSGGSVVVVVDVVDVVLVVVVVVEHGEVGNSVRPVRVPVAPFDQRADTVTLAEVAEPGSVVEN